jgi:TetR/AcrR family transcriptional regulator, ethionamide resistance regulator
VGGVTTSAPADRSRGSRGRRSTRPSGDDRELAILTTAEQLLEQYALADISVDDLAKGAGISRPTFYFYFPSKDGVFMTLFDRVIVEADSALDRLTQNPPDDRQGIWRTGINVFFETFGSHRAVSLAGAAAKATNQEIGELWATFMQKWISHTADVIEAERARGAAPVTLPARELSTALNLMNERVLFASFATQQPYIPENHVLDTLVHIWTTSIYAEPA